MFSSLCFKVKTLTLFTPTPFVLHPITFLNAYLTFFLYNANGLTFFFYPFRKADGGFIHPRTWQVIKIIKQRENFFGAFTSSVGSTCHCVCVLWCLQEPKVKEKKTVKGNLFFLQLQLQLQSVSTFYNICVLILQISFSFTLILLLFSPLFRFQTVLLYVVFHR